MLNQSPALWDFRAFKHGDSSIIFLIKMTLFQTREKAHAKSLEIFSTISILPGRGFHM